MNNYLTHNLGELPSHRFVGILSCQNDPLLETLKSTVTACTKVGKEFEIELLDTVIFPEGGGQPSDIGSLRSSTGEIIEISRAERKKLSAIHYSTTAVDVGTEVEISYDLSRRRDLTQHHTAQHLISGIFENKSLTGGIYYKTCAWALTDDPKNPYKPSYIELEGTPTQEEILKISEIANEFIRKNARIEVKVELVGKDDVILPESVPDDYVGGVLRTVEIIGLDDKNPCCGTHFPSLSYLQAVYIYPTTSPIRQTNCRIYFLTGSRLLNSFNETNSLMKRTAFELNVSQDEIVVDRVKTLMISTKESVKKEKKLREEIAKTLTSRLWSQAGEEGQIKSGLLFRNQPEQDSTNDLEFLNLISFALSNLILNSLPQDYLFILTTSTAIGTSKADQSGYLVMIGSKNCLDKAATLVKENFGSRIKGGGKGRWQGKFITGSSWEEGDLQKLAQILTISLQ